MGPSALVARVRVMVFGPGVSWAAMVTVLAGIQLVQSPLTMVVRGKVVSRPLVPFTVMRRRPARKGAL